MNCDNLQNVGAFLAYSDCLSTPSLQHHSTTPFPRPFDTLTALFSFQQNLPPWPPPSASLALCSPSPQTTARQVHQQHMPGPFLRIRQQFGRQGLVSLRRRASPPRACDWPDLHLPHIPSHVDFR